MEHEDVTNISQELDDWEMSINNTLKQCLIDIDIVEKTSFEHAGRLTTEHRTSIRVERSSVTKKKRKESQIKLQCDNCPFQSNWRTHMSKHKMNKHKYRNCKLCKFSVESNYSPNSVQTIMSAHIVTEHPLEKVNKCNICDYRSFRLDDLKTHTRNNHLVIAESQTNRTKCDECR